MSNERLTSLAGEIISHFSLVRYLSLGIQRVIIHLRSGEAVSLGAREVRLGTDETYTIEVQEVAREEGTQRIDAGWCIGEVHIVKRQDWLELGSDEPDIVGKNPRTLTWGAVGAAPVTARDTQIVNFGAVMRSCDGLFQAMVYLADYPGLVCFTTNAEEISALCLSYEGGVTGSSSEASPH